MSKPVAQSHLLPQIKDALYIERPLFGDDRGTFSELFREEWVPNLPKIVQQNQSFNHIGALRGMHFQKNNPQGKIVSCVYGAILDVMFDIRPGSETFGKGFSRQLNWNVGESLYVPPGCLHGFLTLSRFAVVHYSCTSYYDPKSDGGVRWDSPEIAELFPQWIAPTVSQKDQNLPLLSEYLEQMT